MIKQHYSNLVSARGKRWGKINIKCSFKVGWWQRASGAEVLGLLILMAECSGDGFGEMLADKLGSEAGESSKVASTDGTE